ncbi:MAG: futalosine hydrolase [Flavisolibacter sp.]
MQILLCAATDFEIAPVRAFLREIEDAPVDVLVTGIGLLAASYQLTQKVGIKKPDLIIQAGIAGSFRRDLALGTVTAVRTEVIGDLGVRENGRFRSLFDLNLNQPDVFPWKEGRLWNSMDNLQLAGLPLVDGVTINEISTDPERISHYAEDLGAGIESMEGAALHYIGLMEKIPFIQIRSLSNFVGERDKQQWQMKEAISHLNITLKELLLKLMKT